MIPESQLFISKIEGIDIIQSGTSVLSGANKFQDGSKVGTKNETKIGFVTTSGVNYDIDVGNAKLSITFQFYLTDLLNRDFLHSVLFNKKYCTIVDKFKGELDVFITNVSIIDSDRHIGMTEYRVTCNIQEQFPEATINYRVRVETLTSLILGEIKEELIVEIAKVQSAKLSPSYLQQVAKFLDEVLNSLFSTLDAVFSVLDPIMSVVDDLLAVQQLLFEACQKVLAYPDAIFDVIEKVLSIKDSFVSSFDALGSTSQFIGSRASILGNRFSKEVAIAEPIIRGQKLSEIDPSTLSQFDRQSVDNQQGACLISNKVNFLLVFSDVVSGNFSTKYDFDSTINNALQLLSNSGYPDGEYYEMEKIIKGFAITQPFKELVEVNVVNALPLLRLVFDRYGNLDNYTEIEAINGRVDNDKVSGSVYFLQ